MPRDNPIVPDLDTLRRELRILQEEQGKALALAAYIRVSKEQAEKPDQRRKRINQLRLLLELLATQS